MMSSQSVKVLCRGMCTPVVFGTVCPRLQLPGEGQQFLRPHKVEVYADISGQALLHSVLARISLLFSINFNLPFPHFINFRVRCFHVLAGWKLQYGQKAGKGREINCMRNLFSNCHG